MNFLLIILILFVIYVLIQLRKYSEESIFLITDEEAKDLIINKNAIVLDVRTDLERKIGYYANSLHIPVGDIDKILTEIPDKTTNIVVYCNTGQRSRRASEKIFKLGYCNVRYIKGTYLGLL
jgi:phage shock protein E